MFGGIRKFIREYIEDIRICNMSLEEIDELQKEADEANTYVIPGGPGKPDIRLRSLYTTLGTKDSDIGTREEIWGPPFDDEEGAAPGGEEGAAPGGEEGAAPGGEEGAAPGGEEGAAPGGEEGAGGTRLGGKGEKNARQV